MCGLTIISLYSWSRVDGTGKTIPSLCRILDLLKSGKIENALVVAPKSALGAWERDTELFDDLDQEILKDNITLINYDKVWRGDKKSPYYKKFGCIVLDEAHMIKNRTSRRSKFILKIACMADYRYILTGTPVSNGQLENIWSLYCFLDPYMERGYPYSRIFGGSYKTFQDRYCILNMYHKPSSYIHVRELQDIINEYSYRVKKVDCLDLPEKLPDEIIKVDCAEKALYKKLSTESAILEYEILAENPLSRLVKLRQLCSGHIKLESGEMLEVKNEKLSILQELIEGYEDDKKLVIFAEFKYSISQISALLRRLKIKHVVLDGEQKNKAIWRDFQSDKTIRVIVCQYQTASAGIDLFASDTIIYYEPTLRSNTLEQSRDRIHRTGQHRPCSYIHLLTKGTVEVDIYRALAGYSDFSEKLFVEYMEGYRKSYNS
ncbi:DEAD/DEAH box helicase [Hominilimicola sp.]|uniref:DEAD/DEAH box helicase n=1 Tax=Hominilimicola sp. TaxID=3073571 RepID=UPI0039A0D20E